MSLNVLSRLRSNISRIPCKFKTGETARLASTYKAAVIDLTDKDKPFKIAEVKSGKKLKKGQVRIKVRSCCFNVSDFSLATGDRTSEVATPGYELSGEVMETADAQDVAKGDKVVAFNREALAGFAQEVIVDQKDVWMKPGAVSSADASALVESYGTAVLGLVKNRHLQEKQTLLIALANGHGLAPLDIAANVYKAKVLAVCEHEGEESSKLRDRGAWSALAYTDKGVKTAVRDLTKGKGLDLAYSSMAGPALLTLLSCMAYGGELVYSGVDSLPALTRSVLNGLPSFKLTPVSLWAARSHAFDLYREAVSDALDMCEQGLVYPSVAAKFKLQDINQAYQLFRDKRPLGKVVITLDD